MNEKNFQWSDLGDVDAGRANLGGLMPVTLYRLMEYTLRAALTERYGAQEMQEVFRAAGHLAGREFTKALLDPTLPVEKFLAQLQQKLIENRVGVLRVEAFDVEIGHGFFTVGEDLDCSGLPISGETVCNYDEGFLAGVLEEYTGKEFKVVEVDCWATGARVCRFKVALSCAGR